MNADVSFWRANRRWLAILVLFVIAIYVIVPQLGDFHNSWKLVSHARSGWIIVGLGFTFATYLAAGATYHILSQKRLHYGQLVLVELAAMFVNKLLPAGIGSIGANYAYLRHRRHSPTQAAGVLAVNNLLGIAGHGGLLAVALLLSSRSLGVTRVGQHWTGLQLAIVVVSGVCLLIGALYLVRKKRFEEILSDLRVQLLSYKANPGRLLAALGTSVCLTLCNLLCLAACVAALNVHLAFVVLLFVFSLGLGVGTAAPTPGGLGGFEAGLVGGLTAYHVSAASALAVTLLYRLVSYWVPLFFGAAAFISCRKQGLFKVKGLTSESG